MCVETVKVGSNWVSEREAAGGLALYPKVKHFAIVTEDDLIEILAQEEPNPA